ncbi:MAG: YadA-like family protein [Elusimicrobiota bacterium]|nr:YadA-like family protein [Elusimicrobiota bacterium]
MSKKIGKLAMFGILAFASNFAFAEEYTVDVGGIDVIWNDEGNLGNEYYIAGPTTGSGNGLAKLKAFNAKVKAWSNGEFTEVGDVYATSADCEAVHEECGTVSSDSIGNNSFGATMPTPEEIAYANNATPSSGYAFKSSLDNEIDRAQQAESDLQDKIDQNTSAISQNSSDLSGLQSDLGTANENIAQNAVDIADLQQAASDAETAWNNAQQKAEAITGLDFDNDNTVSETLTGTNAGDANSLAGAINNIDSAVSDLDTKVEGYKTQAETFAATAQSAAQTAIGNDWDSNDGSFGVQTALNNQATNDNVKNATDLIGAISANDANIGDLSGLNDSDNFGSAPTDIVGALNGLDETIGDMSQVDGSHHELVGDGSVAGALAAIDKRIDDVITREGGYDSGSSKIHIGENSFVMDDNAVGVKDGGTGGSISWFDGTSTEQAVNFTMKPMVNGVDVATMNDINGIDNKVNDLRDETRTAMASVAALTALQPLGIDSGRLQFSLGSGFYKGEAAVAAGANFYATENLAFNAGVAADTSFDNNVVKAGLSFGLFKPKKKHAVNANDATINEEHTTAQASKDVAYVTPAQLKALTDRIAALEEQLASK